MRGGGPKLADKKANMTYKDGFIIWTKVFQYKSMKNSTGFKHTTMCLIKIIISLSYNFSFLLHVSSSINFTSVSCNIKTYFSLMKLKFTKYILAGI